MTNLITGPDRRHDFVLLVDVRDGNPNGDPDAGNMPRTDPETMQGIITDVSIKRKVRDYVDLTHGTEQRNKIYVQAQGDALNTKHQRAYTDLGLKSTGSKQRREDVHAARDWMCANFYDIRMFGAVMTTNVNCGQVRGPIQLTFGRSIDPVVPADVTITRVAVTRPEDAEIADTDEGGPGKQTEMGRKAVVPYGLYRVHGFFNPHFAERTGVSESDLALFWEALQGAWDLDRSAARGEMTCRGVYVFSHDSKLGNAPAHKLLSAVHTPKSTVESPRSFDDYNVAAPAAGPLSDYPGTTLSVLAA